MTFFIYLGTFELLKCMVCAFWDADMSPLLYKTRRICKAGAYRFKAREHGHNFERTPGPLLLAFVIQSITGYIAEKVEVKEDCYPNVSY